MAPDTVPYGRAGGSWSAIFAKRPLPGRVKTRLTPPLDPPQAASLACAMLEDAVARGRLAEAESEPVLAFAPPEEAPWFEDRFGGQLALHPQRGDGLAARLAHFFDRALGGEGPRTVIAVGSDSPQVSAVRLAEAHRRLRAGADLVLGPDAGGGYYLIGLRAPHPELFLEVAMSEPDMGRRTLDLAHSLGLAVELLPEDFDVDVARDLERLARHLADRDPAQPDYPRATARALATLVPRSPR